MKGFDAERSEVPTPSLDAGSFGPSARKTGGERGIRTLGRGVTPTHAFQACRLNHSRISPRFRERQGYQPPRVPPHSPGFRACGPKTGGEGGIRTHGSLSTTTAFEAGRFNHSRTSPRNFLVG